MNGKHTTLGLNRPSYSLIHWNVKEALYLRGMQIHGLILRARAATDFDREAGKRRMIVRATYYDMVTTRLLQHIGNKFGSDGCPALVLLVLSGVRVEGEDGRDALRTGDFAGQGQSKACSGAVSILFHVRIEDTSLSG